MKGKRAVKMMANNKVKSPIQQLNKKKLKNFINSKRNSGILSQCQKFDFEETYILFLCTSKSSFIFPLALVFLSVNIFCLLNFSGRYKRKRIKVVEVQGAKVLKSRSS